MKIRDTEGTHEEEIDCNPSELKEKIQRGKECFKNFGDEVLREEGRSDNCTVTVEQILQL